MSQKVVVGISSGVAAFKAVQLIKLLKEAGVEVTAIMTEHAKLMISEAEVMEASGEKVHSQLFPENFEYKQILKDRRVDHIEVADAADVLVIAPATANVIAKLAHGLADDFLTTTVLATTAPVILCPSMNVHMWNNPLVQENLGKLRRMGFILVDPVNGELACGYEGMGRLPEPEQIADEVFTQLNRTASLKGRRVLITAGGTVEPIDDVRFLTNQSSGKMGIALAEECFLRGAKVLLVRSASSVSPRYLIPEKIFSTADELETILKEEVPKHDTMYHAAAVSDFHTVLKVKKAKKVRTKISSKKKHVLELSPRNKILDKIKTWNNRVKLIGFKAESGLSENELIEVAKKRLEESHADAIIANEVGRSDRGFQSDQNQVVIISHGNHPQTIPLQSKRSLAQKIIQYIEGFA